MADSLILIGASVRAVAFSALRAGLRPWCADLFGDRDLRQVVPSTILLTQPYPEGFVELVAHAPPGPWMYTGGLENHPAVLNEIGKLRPLWGNNSETLTLVREPQTVSRLLQRAGLPSPQSLPFEADLPQQGRWILKPYRGAGGTGIHFHNPEQQLPHVRSTHYLQQFIEGPSGAAIFLGVPPESHLLGVTQQLVGERWLHSSPFHYCGSIGPWDLPVKTSETLRAIGQTLVRETKLRGLFGLDFVLHDDVPWLVEINPRYTASVEVLEYATGLTSLALHRDVFVGNSVMAEKTIRVDSVGKAIYFAPQSLTIPAGGSWTSTLCSSKSVEKMPDFADIPAVGQVIERGRPVLTFFVRGPDEATCREQLQRIAYNLDRLFLGGEMQ